MGPGAANPAPGRVRADREGSRDACERNVKESRHLMKGLIDKVPETTVKGSTVKEAATADKHEHSV